MQTPVEISTKILLAEDDNDMRRFLVKALQNAGYAVTSFDNGLSAYNRLREEPFDPTRTGAEICLLLVEAVQVPSQLW